VILVFNTFAATAKFILSIDVHR